MLEKNPKDILNSPQLSKEEARIEPVKKKKSWLFKLILIGSVIWFLYFLWKNPEVVREPVNMLLGKFS